MPLLQKKETMLTYLPNYSIMYFHCLCIVCV